MSEVTEALTRQTATLAQLELTDEEIRTFTRQLGDILGYIEELNSVPVEGVEPLLHPLELMTPLREDVAHAPPLDAEGRSRTLGCAPEVLYDGFKVPQIL